MTPAPRTKNINWPKYVTISNGRIVYRPRIAEAQRHRVDVDKNGFLKPPIKLGKVGDPDSAILRAYLAAKDEIDSRFSGHQQFTLYWLWDQYKKSRKFCALAPKSQKNAILFAKILDHSIKLNNAQAHLGDMLASRLTQPLLRTLMDKRLTTYREAGRKGASMVNREKSFLSAMYTWGMQNIEGLGVPVNPCHKVEGFEENKRDRYVTDDEYVKQAEIAVSIAPYLPIVFELTYLCAARGIEITSLRRPNIQADGILVNRRKGSDDNVILFSPRLRAAVDAALALHKPGKVATLALLVSRIGDALTKSALEKAMQRLKNHMTAIGKSDIFWTLHALKHKGITDAKDKKIGGHVTEAMRNLYDHSVNRVEPPR